MAGRQLRATLVAVVAAAGQRRGAPPAPAWQFAAGTEALDRPHFGRLRLQEVEDYPVLWTVWLPPGYHLRRPVGGRGAPVNRAGLDRERATAPLRFAERQHLLELVRRYSRKHRLFIPEDAAYRELRYDGADLPSIKSLDADNEHVILAMTFSKPCSPGVKTGNGLLLRGLMAPLLRLKGNHDFGSSNLTQHLLDRLLETGVYDRHVAKLRRIYRGKRDALLAALAEAFAGQPAVRWTQPHGGPYVWLTLPPGVDTGPQGELMPAAPAEGVLYVPGPFCYLNGDNGPVPTREARLSFGVAPGEQLREGVRRLARAALGLAPVCSAVRVRAIPSTAPSSDSPPP